MFGKTQNYTLWFFDGLNYCILSVFFPTDIEPECEKSSATTYYWYREALDITSSISESGGLNWKMTVCLLAAWVMVCLAMIKGIQSSGKVSMLESLLTQSSTIPGYCQSLVAKSQNPTDKLLVKLHSRYLLKVMLLKKCVFKKDISNNQSVLQWHLIWFIISIYPSKILKKTLNI